MNNKIRYCLTIGFGVRFERTRNHHEWIGSAASFNRYVKLLKARGWTERSMGLGVNLREPPKVWAGLSDKDLEP